MANKFTSKSTFQNVSTLINRINDRDGKIILNPPYQRNVVWNTEAMGMFVDSVIKGIVPNNVIFNIDKDGNYTCIDGKQRLTSINRFKQNMFPLILSENDKIEHVYYDKLPEKRIHKAVIEYRLMTQQEKNIFNQMELPIISYTELSYEDQVEIFYRIQHGKTLTYGEMIVACFTDDKVTNYFDTFCNEKEQYLRKYISNMYRKEHVPHLINIMYIINSKTPCMPNKLGRTNFMKKITTVDKIKSELSKIDKLIDICYGDNLLGHISIKTGMYINVRYMFIFLVYNLFSGKAYNITNIQYKNLRSAFRKADRDTKNGISKINATKSDKTTLHKLYTLLHSYYTELQKSNCEVSDEEFECDDENDESNCISVDEELDNDEDGDNELNSDEDNENNEDTSEEEKYVKQIKYVKSNSVVKKTNPVKAVKIVKTTKSVKTATSNRK